MPQYDIEHYQRMRDVPGVAAGSMYCCYIKGQKQGQIKGDVPVSWKTSPGDQIQVLAWNHNIFSPIDEATGQPMGKRVHGPLEIVGKVSQAVPLIYQALVTNENITEFKLSCYSQSAEGMGKGAAIQYTVELKNANCCRVGIITSDRESLIYYRIAFTYQQITWTWIKGGITASDDWTARTS
jgi:type VI secretion system secreted protein Hcp